MHVRALELVDFRSYDHVALELQPGVTTFIGPNGQGKTNIVEALMVLSTLRSHRVAHDLPLVRNGCSQAVVRAAVERDGRQLILELEINPGRANRAQVNRAPVARARELLGILRTVIFAPEDLAVVRGDPEQRRRFLDDLIMQRTPRMAGVYADFDRVLKQRNALLRSAAATRKSGANSLDIGVLETWDEHLISHGAQILAERVSLIGELLPYVRKAYDALVAVDSAVGMSYQSSVVPDGPMPDQRELWHEPFRARLLESRDAEIERGVTLVGPHRDDVTVELRNLPLRGYASHGESWSMALALRLASFDVLRSDGDDPVLVLDDVFAELDDQRRARLADLIGDAEQVLVTAAVGADVPSALAGRRLQVVDSTVMADD